MNNKRKNILIVIFVITTIAASCIAVYLYISSDKEKQQLSQNIANLKTEYEEKINKINANNENNKKDDDISNDILEKNMDKIARVTIEDFLNLNIIILANGPGAFLYDFLDFYDSSEELYKNTKDGVTNLKYEDVILKLENYATREFLDSEYYNVNYTNENGYLKVLGGGGTGLGYEVIKVELVSKDNDEYTYNYTARYSIPDGSFKEQTGTIKIKNVDNKFVVSEYNRGK